MRFGQKSARKERCYENRRKKGGKHRGSGGRRRTFHSEGALSAAGIPTDGNLVIETVPGVILIGTKTPVQMVCRPLMEVFDQLGIAENEVEALMGRKGGIG